MVLFGIKKVRMWIRTPRARAKLAVTKLFKISCKYSRSITFVKES